MNELERWIADKYLEAKKHYFKLTKKQHNECDSDSAACRVYLNRMAHYWMALSKESKAMLQYPPFPVFKLMLENYQLASRIKKEDVN